MNDPYPIQITVDHVEPSRVTFTRTGGRRVTASRLHLQRRLVAAEERDLVGVNGVDLDWQTIRDLITRMDEAHDVRMEKLRDRAEQFEETA